MSECAEPSLDGVSTFSQFIIFFCWEVNFFPPKNGVSCREVIIPGHTLLSKCRCVPRCSQAEVKAGAGGGVVY